MQLLRFVLVLWLASLAVSAAGCAVVYPLTWWRDRRAAAPARPTSPAAHTHPHGRRAPTPA